MNKKNIGILTFPTSNSGNVPLSNLVDIICAISKNTHLITGNEGYDFFKNDPRLRTYPINCEHRKNSHNIFMWIFKYITTQFKMSFVLSKSSKKVDLWIFFIGGDCLLIPMIAAKIFRKQVILVFAGSITQSLKSEDSKLYKIVRLISNINCRFSDSIILYSPILIEQWNLKKFNHKIKIAPKHFLDFNIFKKDIKIANRKNLIGYVGRFSNEKGVINLIEAIPLTLKMRSDVNFLFIGDGPEKDKMEIYLQQYNLNGWVEIKEWVKHEELPAYLNKLKLVVIPSYTEGLPNLMLEAMACGTPVVATPVGSIPDIIRDSQNGFIMQNNSSAVIAENIINILNRSDLEEISEKAKILISENFTFEMAVKRYYNIIYNI
ncbi:MAG: glycosyltransferase family 4 protein [Methanomethylovorans sp.]|jgi:glycosyltransferase involved in cell wall biosynthesis|nr:glycosyltransferase family 4 protein [Methanomethylovorans sp.]